MKNGDRTDVLANQVVRGPSPGKDPSEGARWPCLIPGRLMDAAAEYPAQESLGVVPALICGDSDILIKYRGFLAISLAEISGSCF